MQAIIKIYLNIHKSVVDTLLICNLMFLQNKGAKKCSFFALFPLMPASSATTALTIKMQEGEIENKESL
mgnify:CR=1 FL=1